MKLRVETAGLLLGRDRFIPSVSYHGHESGRGRGFGLPIHCFGLFDMRVLFLALCLVLVSALSVKPVWAEEPRIPEQFAIHGQITAFGQGYPAFASPYEGTNSLPASGQIRQTLTATAFISFRMPWSGGEWHINPEYSQGFGLNSTLGIAGFTNGDAQKGGSLAGTLYPARLYYRQTFALGSGMSWQESGPNQLAGYVPDQRLSVVVGKFAAVDFFQSSAYAGDPRRQFSNWSLWGPGHGILPLTCVAIPRAWWLKLFSRRNGPCAMARC